MTSSPEHGTPGFFQSRTGIVALGFAGVATFYLWTEHRAHLLGVLPYLLLLACPLMHLFMHHGHGGGHGGHGGHHGDDRDASAGGSDKGEAGR